MNKVISIEIDKDLGDAFENIVGKDNISDLLEKYIRVYTIERQSSIESRCTPHICKKCGMSPNEYGQDYCIANLGNVMNACCGHGTGEGYVQFDNGITIRGNFKVENDTVKKSPSEYVEDILSVELFQYQKALIDMMIVGHSDVLRGVEHNSGI